MPGADNLIVEARTALLDAIAALEAHKASVILIGAQAIYLRTGNATFALAEATKDSDLAIDTRTLGEDPLLEEAMTSAGFILNPVSQQPGAWMSPNGIPVDLMVTVSKQPGAWMSPNGIPVDLMVPSTSPAQEAVAASVSRPTTSTRHAEPPDSRRRSSTSLR